MFLDLQNGSFTSAGYDAPGRNNVVTESEEPTPRVDELKNDLERMQKESEKRNLTKLLQNHYQTHFKAQEKSFKCKLVLIVVNVGFSF